MQIGIVITQTAHANKIIDITREAVKRGHKVSIFMTDDGIYLVKNAAVADLRNLENVEMSLCNFSFKGRNLEDSEIPEGVINGTQYQNSLIHNECDKILIF
ncbi:MAG: DsrE family protein [Thermodesulfovibrionales bacterium]|nr:DsrE family protein [Thermodesulfovibrionales bacterium]